MIEYDPLDRDRVRIKGVWCRWSEPGGIITLNREDSGEPVADLWKQIRRRPVYLAHYMGRPVSGEYSLRRMKRIVVDLLAIHM